MCADTDLIERAVVFVRTVVLALLDGAFDCTVGIVTAGRVFHDDASFHLVLPLTRQN